MKTERLIKGFRQRLKRAISSFLLAPVTIFVWAAASAQAQDLTLDLTEFSLEELMNLDVLSVNVLGTHTHLQGEWMIGYRYMLMSMDGNRDGTDGISTDGVLQDFVVTPTEMTMQMHMVEVMYAPTDAVTLMAMLPYLRLSMDHLTRMGMRFTTESAGMGDVSVQALFTFSGNLRRDRHHVTPWAANRFLLRAGLTLPTGSIDERGDTPAGSDQRLPYPMQLGSGTPGLISGITYLGQAQNWAWTAETIGTIRLGTNSNDYSLGDRLHLIGWVARRLTDRVNLAARIDAQNWANIDGADPDLSPAMVPTADPNRRSGERVELSVGLNFYLPQGDVNKGHRLAIEGGAPVYESLGGPQLESDWYVNVGWTWTF